MFGLSARTQHGRIIRVQLDASITFKMHFELCQSAGFDKGHWKVT